MLLTAPSRLFAQDAAVDPPVFPVLTLGEPQEFFLGEGNFNSQVDVPGVGRAWNYLLKPTRSGPVTVTVDSVEGNTFIRVLDESGKVILADDDGGIEWNPRLVVETVAGQRVILNIGFKYLREGRLSVLVSPGEVPLPEGRALDEARQDFFARLEPLLVDPSRKMELGGYLYNQAERLRRLQDWPNCLETSRHLLALGDEVDHDVFRMVAELHVGISLRKLHRVSEALPHLRRSVAQAVEQRQAPFELFAQDQLGLAWLEVGELDEARRALERAHLIARATGDDANRESVAADLGLLGVQYELHGAFMEALDVYALIREAAREAGDRDTECVSLARTASVQMDLGQYELAHELMQEAMVLGAEDVREELQIELQVQMAQVLRDLGRPDEARSVLEGALEFASADLLPGARGGLYAALTQLYFESGERELAQERAQLQVTLGRESGIKVTEAIGLNNLAYMELKDGSLDRAASLSARAAEIIGDEIGDERVSILGTRVEVALALGDAETAEALLRLAGQLAANVDSERLGIEVASLIRATGRWALFGEYQQELVNLQLQGLDPKGDEAREVLETGFKRIGRWRSRALLETMAQRRTEALTPFEDISPDDMRRSVLPAGGTLIHYVDGLDQLYAYALTADSLSWHVIGPRDEILGESDAFLAGIADPEALAAPGVIARDGAVLFERLLRPILEAGPDGGTGAGTGAGTGGGALSIVPTPSLAALPFEALVISAPEQPRDFEDVVFVIDRHEVSYAPSAPVLGLLASLGPRPAGGGGLVLADPDYVTPRTGMLPATNRRLPALPGTRVEALAIARMLVRGSDGDRLESLDDRPDVRITLDGIEIALGKEASTSTLKRDLSGYSVLHFAMHGIIDEGDARKSGLVMSSSDGDDGFLSVDEIAELDIDADLAVLSACETARGEVRRGEGVQSMARALMNAGARSVVASLWQVDDRETQRIMSAFYASRGVDGRSDSAALRQARLTVRRAGKQGDGFVGLGRGGSLGGSPGKQALSGRQLVGHPYFWAPFVYVGLPR